MCWIKDLNEPVTTICCGFTVHSKKIAFILGVVFLTFLIGMIFPFHTAFGQDRLFPKMAFVFVLINTFLLFISMVGLIVKPFLVVAGMLVYIQFVAICVSLGFLLGIFAMIPTSGFPVYICSGLFDLSPMIADEFSQKGFVILCVILSMLSFFMTQIPWTGFVCLMKYFTQERESKESKYNALPIKTNP